MLPYSGRDGTSCTALATAWRHGYIIIVQISVGGINLAPIENTVRMYWFLFRHSVQYIKPILFADFALWLPVAAELSVPKPMNQAYRVFYQKHLIATY